jgi:3-hydroxyacyl-CoA dehydrogenase
MHALKSFAVIGAGVMGSGIAAQIANAGYEVWLLDIVPEGSANRNAIAEGAIERMRKAEPSPLMSAAAARRIRPGNIEDDLDKLAACDWIIEAVIERLDVKRALYQKLEAVRKPGSVISSNTSTIPLARLIEGASAAFARDFLITHFFNPPRYMRLLELVSGPATDPEQAARIAAFCDEALGKTIVRCKDTPGFIANRLGVFWLQVAVIRALDLGLDVEEADAVMGRPLGIPRTGVFGLLDLIGLDLMPNVNASLAALLPPSDPFHAFNRDLPLIKKLIAEGYTGRKGKGGFYRLRREGEKKIREALDLVSGTYRPEREVSLPEGSSRDPRGVLALPDRLGAYARSVLAHTFAYAASLVPEAADEITDIDAAMRLGYNWKWGPFELMDRIGLDEVAKLFAAEGLSPPPLFTLAASKGGFYRLEGHRLLHLEQSGAYRVFTRPAGVLLLGDVKRQAKPLRKTAAAALWDLGDGVAGLELTSKMGTLEPDTLSLIEQALPLVRERFKALVIHNEGEPFSLGANLGLALFAANIAAWGEIEATLARGQKAMLALKYAPFPVVAAPAGMALGGGCEILLHADAIVAHAETYAGLVECGVGLVPGWGGTKEMLARLAADPSRPKGPMPAVAAAFEMISTARVSKSAEEAREMGILRPADLVVMNRDRVLARAKARALELAEGYRPPEAPVFFLPGPSGKHALMMAAEGFRRQGLATAHDLVVAEALAEILTGGPEADPTEPIGEETLLLLEREAFLRLIKLEPTLARIEHTLATGKPLRN